MHIYIYMMSLNSVVWMLIVSAFSCWVRTHSYEWRIFTQSIRNLKWLQKQPNNCYFQIHSGSAEETTQDIDFHSMMLINCVSLLLCTWRAKCVLLLIIKRTHKSCHTHEWNKSGINVSSTPPTPQYFPRAVVLYVMHGSCHTYECVKSNAWLCAPAHHHRSTNTRSCIVCRRESCHT